MNVRVAATKWAIAALTLYGLGFSTPTLAGCLSGEPKATSIYSVVRGIYANAVAGEGTAHFIVLDKATCTRDGEASELGNGTLTDYYVRVKDTDKVLLNILLAAQAQKTVVEFRVVGAVNGYNEVAYVVAPASARAQ